MTLRNLTKNERRRSHEPFQTPSTNHFPVVSPMEYQRCFDKRRLSSSKNRHQKELVHRSQRNYKHQKQQHNSLIFNYVPPIKFCQN